VISETPAAELTISRSDAMAEDHSIALPVVDSHNEVPVPESHGAPVLPGTDHGALDSSASGMIAIPGVDHEEVPSTAPIIALPGLSDGSEADAAASSAALSGFGGQVVLPALDHLKGDDGEEGHMDDTLDEGPVETVTKPRKKRKTNDDGSAPTPKRQKTAPTGPNDARCTCKRSQCLKSYCTCFANGLFCEGCGCKGKPHCWKALSQASHVATFLFILFFLDCVNLPAYAAQVDEARKKTIGRNPNAFKVKVEGDRHIKGCKCTKTACLKKYCECFEVRSPNCHLANHKVTRFPPPFAARSCLH